MSQMNISTDQDVVDYIESSATLIENLNSEVKKLASELTTKNQEIAALKRQLANTKTASVVNNYMFTNEQANLLANNLINLRLVKSASVEDLATTLKTDNTKVFSAFNGLIAKVASNHTSGRGIAPDRHLEFKQLTEEELIEQKALSIK